MLGSCLVSGRALHATSLPCLKRTGTLAFKVLHPAVGSTCPGNRADKNLFAGTRFISNWAQARRPCVVPGIQRTLSIGQGYSKQGTFIPKSFERIDHAMSMRTFRHLAQSPEPKADKEAPSTSPTSAKPPPTKPTDEPPPTAAQQRRTDWTIIKRLMVNVWPKNDWKTRSIVLFGFVLLVAAKVCETDHFN